MKNRNSGPAYLSTTNACKLCTPLGACLAFKGIAGTVAYLHGSQGCATYMRRYIISHFNEPVDIASSSMSEKHAVYGGGPNLKQGLKNVTEKYQPDLIGIATTCLTETIGDDVDLFLHQYKAETESEKPLLVRVSTPSYSGTHMEGFHQAVRAVAEALVTAADTINKSLPVVNLLPGLVSPADLRYLKELFRDFGLGLVLLPDISETLDGPIVAKYEKIQSGGTSLEAIAKMAESIATLEFGHTMGDLGAGQFLQEKFGVECRRLQMPIGIRSSDLLVAELEALSGCQLPLEHRLERGRLIDSYVDCHKYVFGKKAIIYGEEDFVVGMAGWLAEIGVQPVFCASGGRSGSLAEMIRQATKDIDIESPEVREAMDFYEIAELAESLKPDLLVGHSKGYSLSRKLKIPLIRVGFPIHDRMGGQRLLHLGYRGAQVLYDRVVNALIAHQQENSPVGYTYM